jgi:hypothetical protein
MIINKQLRRLNEPRQFAIDYISEMKKQNPLLKVVDVGGGICCWSPDTTHVVDSFVVPGSRKQLEEDRPGLHIFEFDINLRAEWKELLDYVEENGKFDYSICTHTLEDIFYPNIVCDMLMKISKAGIIAVPSKYAEYLRFEKQQAIQNNQTGELFSGYRGFFHHRWICGMKDDVFVGYEKSNYWEIIAMPNYETDKGFFTELCFMWENDFKYTFNDVGKILGHGCMPKLFELLENDDLTIEDAKL